MRMYNIIFSSTRSDRIKRHLLFWAVVYLYQVVRISFLFPQNQIWAKAPLILASSLFWGILHLMIISYSVVYYLVPKYFVKKKYVLFATGILLLFLFVFGLNILYNLIITQFTHAIGVTAQRPFIFLRGSIIRLFGNAPLICGILLSLKTLKTWHLKQLENEMLTRETANTELQLLKAQIHPHFLFNTLNNIYSFTLTKSPLAAELVQKLSDMLNYMIIDCQQTVVPVDKEIQLIKDYIALEKVRYGSRLDLQVKIEGDNKNKLITPLLMIPFVENSFKHGASKMLGTQWINIFIKTEKDQIDFHLSNSKPTGAFIQTNKNGIGLTNVRKRLQLLYPERHSLEIRSTEYTYEVNLKLTLEEEPVPGGIQKTPPLKKPAYA